MLLSLDNLAHRYGLLPSEALSRASTLDLMVLDLGAKWVNYQGELEEERRTGIPRAPKKVALTQEQMMSMIKQARSES